MTPERWTRLTELFESALEHEPAERAAFLASACAEDPFLRREVESMLESHERAGTFGDTPAFDFAEGKGEGTLDVGSRLGRYEIIGFLAAGGMGEVYRARDPQLGREVGIKILPQRREITRDQLKRFEREARAVGALNHPNILRVYDIGVEADVPYVVSELLDGETLRARLSRGPLSVEQAVDIALQIVSGLTAAHDKGIVHRDLKPENLFVTRDGVVKILDFGLAKQTGGVAASHIAGGTSFTGDGLVMGTAGYMSPEQVRGQQADARSDVFAFGAVLYEMLTGRRAFSGDSLVETMNAILTVQPPALSNPPAELDLVVRQCLEKDPARRIPSARELALALEAVRLSLQTVPQESVHPVRAGQRRPAWRFVGAAAIVSAALAAWLLLGSRPVGRPAIGAAGRPAIAVMTFDNPSGAPEVAWLTRGVPNMLTTALAQAPGLDVIGSTRLQAAAQQSGENASSTDSRGRMEVARRSGAGAFVTGSVFKAANGIRIDVHVEEIGSGRVIDAQSVQGPDVFLLVDELGERIRSGLQIGAEGGRHVADVTSGSLEAYKLFDQAVDARHNLRYADARTLLLKAVGIDASFAMAYYELALIARTTGDNVERARYLGGAVEHVARLPERQRLLVQAEEARAAGGLKRGIDLLEQLVRRYPDEEEAYYQLALAYLAMNDDAANLWAYERGARNLPTAAAMRNQYGFALLRAARYDEALAQFDEYIRLAPSEPNPYDSMADAYLFIGEPESALIKYREALALDPSFLAGYRCRALALPILGRYDEALSDVAEMGRLADRGNLPRGASRFITAFLLTRTGRYRAAHDEIAAGLAVASRQRDAEAEAGLELLAAWTALDEDRPAAVPGHVSRALARATELTGVRSAQLEAVAQLFAGLADLRSSNPASARRRLATMPRLARPDPAITFWTHTLRGEIALAAGDLPAADAAFAAAEPATKMPYAGSTPITSIFANDWPGRDGRARVLAARGDLKGAAARYRELLTPGRAAKWTSVLEPRFVLALARLLDRLGDAAGAKAQDERFVALWHAADPGLPELEQARRRLKPETRARE